MATVTTTTTSSSHNIDISGLDVESLINVFWKHAPLVRDQIDRSFTCFIQMIQVSRTLSMDLKIQEFKLAVVEDAYQREAHVNSSEDEGEDSDVDHQREMVREKEPIIQQMDTLRKGLSQILDAIDNILNTTPLFCNICRSSLQEHYKNVLPSSEKNTSLFDLYCSEEDTSLSTNDNNDNNNKIENNGKDHGASDNTVSDSGSNTRRNKRSRRL